MQATFMPWGIIDMTVPFTQDFFDRAAVHHLGLYRTQLHAELTTVLGVDARTAADRAQFEQFFTTTWAEVTENHGVTDSTTIGKYYKIRLLRNKWSQSPLHSRYVAAMMAGGDTDIKIADGIAAVHQNIVEQHYA
jgi:hypothetical protein